MSLVGLGSLHGKKGLSKGKPSPVTDINIAAVAGSLLYSSSAPSVTGISGNITVNAVAGALLYSSSAPTVNAGGATTGQPIGLLLALTKAA